MLLGVWLMATRVKTPSRNGPCPCGSGRKYKHCCLLKPASLGLEARLRQAEAAEKRGAWSEAATLYSQLLGEAPSFVPGLRAFALFCFRQGKRAEALTLFRRASELAPEDVELLTTLGTLLVEERQFADAIVCLHRATRLDPGYADAHNSLGYALYSIEKFAEAEFCCREALRLQPDSAAALINLGNIFRSTGRIADALQAFQHALKLQPGFDRAWLNLGLVLLQTKRWSETVAAFQQAVQLSPGLPLAHYNLAVAHQQLGDYGPALVALEVALALDSQFVEAHLCMGNIRKDQGRLVEALACFSRALALRPDYHPAHSNMLFTTAFMDDMSAQQIFDLHCGWARLQAGGLPAPAPHSNARLPAKRLKLGYVSPDFRTHACAFFLEPLLAAHDATQVEVYAYAEVGQPDEVTARLASRVAQWRSTVGLSDDAVADLIRADGIDVLVDLAGHTAGNRLLALARKPAPVQLTYLGYPATTGLQAFDWRLTDGVTEPIGQSERYYMERLYRLPHSLWCYQPFADMGEVSALPALAGGGVTFGSFNNYAKVGPRVVALWASVLHAVPGSRLLMITVPAGEAQSALLAQFAGHGIGPERLELHGKLARTAYVAAFSRVDVALDPFPCNGGTTTCDALWMGLPVVTLVGERFLSRASLSVLTAAGWAEFAAADEAAYVACCVRLASDVAALAALRAAIRPRIAASPLMDAQGFARDIEAAYRNLWAQWCAQESPL